MTISLYVATFKLSILAQSYKPLATDVNFETIKQK